MSKAAVIFGDVFIYWSSVIIALAALAAILLFLALYTRAGGSVRASAVFIPLAIVLSVVLSRAIHWYCRYESYGSFLSAMTDYTGGGYAMLGVFIGCVAAAGIVRLARLTDDLPGLLDCVAPAGALGIAVGRLSALFNTGDRGMLLESVKSLPFASAVTSAVSGGTEYRLATFMLQSVAAFAVCAALLLFIRRGDVRRRSGDIFLILLLLIGASDCLLDSTRYDALFLRSNGFVSIVQICGALCAAAVLVVFAVRLVKTRGVSGKFIALWVGALALFGGAGYMEYYVQRHGDRAAFAYSVMAVCMAGICAIALLTRHASVGAVKRRGLHEKTR